MRGTAVAGEWIEARDRERRELARVLHSTTAQQIAALRINLDLILKSNEPFSPRTAKALEDSISLVSECAREIRRLCYALHPPLLDEIGLIATLRALPKVQKIQADLQPDLPRLAPDVEISLYRMIEEALPRISTLRIAHSSKSLTVDVDLRSASPAIRERVRALHGRIARASGLLRITLPLKIKAAKSGSSR
jgi:signal transduction histidine kinase